MNHRTTSCLLFKRFSYSDVRYSDPYCISSSQLYKTTTHQILLSHWINIYPISLNQQLPDFISRINNYLISFPESTELCFFVLPPGASMVVESLSSSLSLVLIFFTSSRSWKQSGPQGSLPTLNSGPRRLVVGPGWFDCSRCWKSKKKIAETNLQRNWMLRHSLGGGVI